MMIYIGVTEGGVCYVSTQFSKFTLSFYRQQGISYLEISSIVGTRWPYITIVTKLGAAGCVCKNRV